MAIDEDIRLDRKQVAQDSLAGMASAIDLRRGVFDDNPIALQLGQVARLPWGGFQSARRPSKMRSSRGSRVST